MARVVDLVLSNLSVSFVLISFWFSSVSPQLLFMLMTSSAAPAQLICGDTEGDGTYLKATLTKSILSTTSVQFLYRHWLNTDESNRLRAMNDVYG
jgi:hypothetical protein